ncbi:MAG: polysaccharide pyruvyl transferase family protein [Ruminococcus sp.]|nr:polysaccharide pyruvyl transferase family protein [Ruminococcus sp.]
MYSRLKLLRQMYITFSGKTNILGLLHFLIGKKAYIIGTPVYNNLGDSAIALVQMKFLKDCGFSNNRIIEITYDEYFQYVDTIKASLNKNSLIIGLGGGNMGNQWYIEEKFRYNILDTFPKNPVIIFPQTIFYTDNEDGNSKADYSKRYYNNRENLTLFAREKKSLDLMCKMYDKCNVFLSPDIVLYADKEYFQIGKNVSDNILLCFRSDAEKSIEDSDIDYLKDYLNNQGLNYKITDMYSDVKVTKKNRFDCVKRKMSEFANAKLVITDRLHGMVFSAITGTPCIVLTNYNHKVKGVYDWIDYLPYIKYAENINDVLDFIPQLLILDKCEYNNTQLMPYYEKLSEVVKKYV